MANGDYVITQEKNNEAKVWALLFDILEYRMSRGEFTVIDATCSKTKDIQQYKDLADHYRYRVYIVDFTKVPLETCLAQNKQRPADKWVPDTAIKNIYARFATQAIPGGVTVIQPNEFDTLLETPVDVSKYKKLVFVGDIHGCYDTLMQYSDFKNGLKDDVEYIFLGDYIDRGNQNYEVLNFLGKIKDLPNVCLLMGNHENHLQDFGNSITVKSREFEEKTKIELQTKGYTEKEARMLYRKFRQFSHITWNGLEILACHGGIPNLTKNLLYVPSEKLIKGSGSYSDYLTVTASWMAQTNSNQYLIHGHRNTEGSETQIADRVFNLEGKVEFGGQLRIVELDKDGFHVVELDDCQPVTTDLNTETRPVETVEEAISYLRNNKFIEEKKLDEQVSSFNFTRDAFYKGNWNRQTILARGLFIDTEAKKIIARSYEKFFKIGEVNSTELAVLKSKLQFPVSAYVKENGFLAIVSYDYRNNDLFIASKSTNKGDYVEYIKQQLEPYKEKLLTNFRSIYTNLGYSNLSYVFECINIDHDPHIIKYNENKLVLLDCIFNTLQYQTIPYSHLIEEAKYLGCPLKQKAYEFKDWDSFRQFYAELQEDDYQYNGEYVEGFVFVDANGFQTKCKTPYYNEWKKLRGIADQTLRQGYIVKTGMLINALENLFYGFCKDLYNNYRDSETKTYPFKTDIISLRERFLTTQYDQGRILY